MRSEGSRRSGRSAGTGSEASTATGHVACEVVVPMPSRDDLGKAHTDPPLDRVTLAARQPDPAWTQQVPPGPDGWERHLTAVWDTVPGGAGYLPHLFSLPHCGKGGPHPWYALETQCCPRLECSQWERFPPEQFLWEHHWNKCRRRDNQIHHHEFPSS